MLFGPLVPSFQFIFQFIRIPTEWGWQSTGKITQSCSGRFQFIGIPTEWGLTDWENNSERFWECFQFIGIPTEWGQPPLKPSQGKGCKSHLRGGRPTWQKWELEEGSERPETLMQQGVERLNANRSFQRFFQVLASHRLKDSGSRARGYSHLPPAGRYGAQNEYQQIMVSNL